MEEDDKGCPMIKMGVSGWVFLLVLAYPGSPGQKAVKRLCVCVCVYVSPDFVGFFLGGGILALVTVFPIICITRCLSQARIN